jgi:polysaccharide export outer membrane protein
MVRGGRDVLRAGDEVRVTLGGVPRDERVDTEFRINDDGSITMPNLDPVRAAGSTASMLERVLEQQYKSKGIYTNPTVSVYVAGRFINVIGEVRLPQRVEFTSDLTVLSAVAAAGGFTDYANKKAVRVTRGGQVITVNAVAASRNPAADERLQAGDTIEVQRSIF